MVRKEYEPAQRRLTLHGIQAIVPVPAVIPAVAMHGAHQTILRKWSNPAFPRQPQTRTNVKAVKGTRVIGSHFNKSFLWGILKGGGVKHSRNLCAPGKGVMNTSRRGHLRCDSCCLHLCRFGPNRDAQPARTNKHQREERAVR